MADETTGQTLVLTLDSGGDAVIRLRPDLAPGHVERITELARDGFYDGVTFHRVIAGFMAQGGDPTGTGTGGSPKPDLKAEFSSEPHVRGVCSMAKPGEGEGPGHVRDRSRPSRPADAGRPLTLPSPTRREGS